MIVYNVTINVDSAIHEEWLKWMKEKHLADVMATGMFETYKFLKLLSKQEDEIGETYAIQYFAKSIENYERYKQEFAPQLQLDGKKLFDGKFHAFRTLLEEVA
jgi:Domain of unknown function (DUF4286)